MISVSTQFANAQEADSNIVAWRVRLLLGNYASASGAGASAVSSGDLSASYPAAGAIDGDRTELNIGAASEADNDVGLSSWRSSGIPDNGDTVTLDVEFNTTRAISRIKLYHMDGHGLQTYSLSYWDGAAWQVFAATSDIVAGDQVSITTTLQLDVVEFDEISTTKIRLIITATEVAMDYANVVELEAYRILDISDRVRGVSTNSGRDYKIGNPIASQASINCLNTDRFFSISHTPTAAEITDGFVNDELLPGIGIEIDAGFDVLRGDAPELVRRFTGTIDKIGPKSLSRQAVIQATDYTKSLLRGIDSSKLKTAIDIGDAVKYVLNRGNISNYEMSVDTVGVSIDYFFTEASDKLSTVRDLVTAAADGIFMFDEYGTAVFKVFATAIGHDQVFTSEADWETGTLDHIDSVAVPGKISYLHSDSQTWNASTAGWTGRTGTGTINFAADADGLKMTCTNSATTINDGVYRAIAHYVGEWAFDLKYVFTTVGSNPAQARFSIALMSSGAVASPPSGVTVYGFANAYILNVGLTGVNLIRTNALGQFVTFVTSAAVNLSTYHNIRVRRGSDGTFEIFIDDVLAASAIDSTFSSGPVFGYNAFLAATTIGTSTSVFHIKNANFKTPSSTDGVGTWDSPTIDLSATAVAYGDLDITFVLNSGTAVFYTRSSDDGVTWDARVLVSGSTIGSTFRRYLEVRAVLTFTSADSPNVTDMTVNWTTQAGSAKYAPAPASFTLSYETTLMDAEQEVSDSLAGDTAILNDLSVQAQPLVLTGDITDTVWQGVNGVPPENISVSNPLNVNNGDTLTYNPVISGGMDVTYMSGADPAAAVVTFAGGATGTWVFSSQHPTQPVLVITITASGSITDLRLVGKKFSSSSTLVTARATDAESIAKFGRCADQISNAWIVSQNQAQVIAEKMVENFSQQISYIPSVSKRPLYNAQVGDRVTVIDYNLDVSQDFVIAGLQQKIDVGESADATVDNRAVLLKVPDGL